MENTNLRPYLGYAALMGVKPGDILIEEEKVFDPEMYLSEHFQLKEFTRSATALSHGIDNMPGEEEVLRLKALCENVLEPLRKRFGVIRITSGYRCARVNDLVGGARQSQHLYGEAADIHCGSTLTGEKYYDFIRKHCDFDQMLLEFTNGKHPRLNCLHVSFKSDRGSNRHITKSHYPLN